ncbi:MAG: hypothetical protein CUN55_20950, partial [Phototrophicales bacterium]
TGFELLNSLKNNPELQDIPVIFLSANKKSEDRIRGLREGAYDYITKPFNPEELILRVERALQSIFSF